MRTGHDADAAIVQHGAANGACVIQKTLDATDHIRRSRRRHDAEKLLLRRHLFRAPGQAAIGILYKARAGRVRRLAGDTGGLEGGTVGIGDMAVAFLHEERIVGRKRIQFSNRRNFGIAGDAGIELLCAHPFPGLASATPFCNFDQTVA